MILQHLREFFARLSVFRKVEPVDSVDSFCDFLATRAAFVSQKKLFEYVKTRMGMNFPRAFADDVFIKSLNIAKWHVYAACLSDLAIWMAAQVHARTGDAGASRALAGFAFDRAVRTRIDMSEFTGDPDQLVEQFGARAALVDWKAMAEGEAAFTLSPKALVKWAPIAPELKKYDVEIVLNSLRFAWQAMRQQFRDAADVEAVAGDWKKRMANSEW